MTLHFSNRITLAEINNLYISLSILLLIHAYRLRKFSCVIPAFQFIIFHLLSLYSFYVTLHWTFDGSLLLPDFFYLVSMFLGTGIIINRRENIKEIHSLNKEKFVIHRELELAKKVQDSLFPKDIKINGLKYQVFRQSHNFIGGDFYDFVMLREGNTGIFITDIAGHGISSAMVATIMKVIVATIPYQFKLLPEKFLTHLDKRLSVDLDHYHASAIYMFMNFQTKKIFLGNAGHPYPIYCDKGGEFVELNTEGSILGFQITDPIVTELEIHFNEGDRFVLYTDGLVESPTESGKFVSEKDLINILNLHKEIKDLKTFKTKVLDDLTNKFGLKKFTDDTMVLFFEITKRNLI
jgi:serine phosphatase RsbU (regulator of sigma subunit)